MWAEDKESLYGELVGCRTSCTYFIDITISLFEPPLSVKLVFQKSAREYGPRGGSKCSHARHHIIDETSVVLGSVFPPINNGRYRMLPSINKTPFVIVALGNARTRFCWGQQQAWERGRKARRTRWRNPKRKGIMHQKQCSPLYRLRYRVERVSAKSGVNRKTTRWTGCQKFFCGAIDVTAGGRRRLRPWSASGPRNPLSHHQTSHGLCSIRRRGRVVGGRTPKHAKNC